MSLWASFGAPGEHLGAPEGSLGVKMASRTVLGGSRRIVIWRRPGRPFFSFWGGEFAHGIMKY